MSDLAEQIRKAEERVGKLKQEQAEEEQKRKAAIEAEVIRWLKVKRSDQWAQWLADAANRPETERRRRSQRAKKRMQPDGLRRRKPSSGCRSTSRAVTMYIHRSDRLWGCGKNRASAGSTPAPGPPQEPRDTGAKRKCLYGVKDSMSCRVVKRGNREDIVSFAGGDGVGREAGSQLNVPAMQWGCKKGR